MYHIGFAGLDHGWFRLEMCNKGARPSLEGASFVYYVFAGLGRGLFRLERYERRGFAHS